MKKLIFLMMLLCSVFSCDDNKPTLIRAGIKAEYFVKEKMKYPEEVEFTSEHRGEQLSVNKFKVYQTFTAKNAFGVKSSYVYRAIMVYDGEGDWTDGNNWDCEELIIEDTATGEQYR